MADFLLDWANAGANGSFDLASGMDTLGVTVTTTTNSAGQTAAAISNGTPTESGLWVNGLSDKVTSTLSFDAPVENLSFEIYDLDQHAGSWDDRITIIATDADGNQMPVNLSDLDGLHSVDGDTLDADGNASPGVETTGAADSVTVAIAGPITGLTFVFDVGESAANSGTFGVSDMAFSAAALDYVVEGTGGNDLIDGTYTGDPEGDRIDAGDAADGSDDDSVIAGAGDDTVLAGLGDDTILGGAGDDVLNGNEGDDSILGGAGADSIYGETGNDYVSGGEGDDHIEGNEGDDTLIGGGGDDWMRGSYGNDDLRGGAGDDYVWAGYGDDTIHVEDGFGNDTIEAEEAQEISGDTLDLSAVTSDLRIDLSGSNPEAGSFSDGTSTATFVEIENIVLGGGQDTLVLGDISGNDRVEGFAGPTDNGDGTYSGIDMLDVSTLHDIDGNLVNTSDVSVTDTNGDGTGDAVLSFSGGQTLTLVGVLASEVTSPAQLEAIGIPANPLDYVVEGTAGDDAIDLIYTGDPDGDRVDYGDAADGSNDDMIAAGAGNDSVYAFDGDDSVSGGDGNDEVHGGVGADTLLGDAGDDTLAGEDGDDSISGGLGNDTLSGGAGSDVLSGGDDSDRFVGLSAGDTVDGGAGGVDHDVLDLSGTLSPGGSYTISQVADSDGNGHDGTVSFFDASGALEGTLDFSNIEEIVPCFTPGTPVATSHGVVPVETLEVGDKVVTRDSAYQEIRWIGRRAVNPRWLAAAPELRPVLICQDALGQDMPQHDILVSPNHRMLVTNAIAMAMFGEPEVLVAAKHLVGLAGVSVADEVRVTYLHMLFDRHELVLAGGTWSESFQPGDYTLAGIGEDSREEIFTLFPELRGLSGPAGRFDAARRILKRHEARLLRP